MKRVMKMAVAMALAGSALAVQPAHAARVGIAIGVPLYGPGVYGYPYYGYPYYPPAVVAVPAAPTTYIEQQPAALSSAQAEGGYWYYCKDPAGYYPTVKTCMAGWQKVAPLPAH